MRVDYRKVFPEGVQAMAGLERAVRSATLEPELLELVRIRASQINGCTYCLAMHNRDARSRGDHQTRLDTLAAWREAPYYTARERAVLAWCEALTDRPRTGAHQRGLRRGRGRVLPRGDSRLDVRDRRDQRLEPARCRAALGRAAAWTEWTCPTAPPRPGAPDVYGHLTGASPVARLAMGHHLCTS